MDTSYGYSQNMRNGGDICLANSATTHTILRDRKYFSRLMLTKVRVTTMSSQSDVSESSGKAHIMLPNGTILSIQHALYTTRSTRNLLSFKDIRLKDTTLKRKVQKMWSIYAVPLMIPKSVYWRSCMVYRVDCIIHT